MPAKSGDVGNWYTKLPSLFPVLQYRVGKHDLVFSFLFVASVVLGTLAITFSGMNDTVLMEKKFDRPTYKTFKKEIEGSSFECPCQLSNTPYKVSDFIGSLEVQKDSACNTIVEISLTSDALQTEQCLFANGPYKVARLPDWIQSLSVLCGTVTATLSQIVNYVAEEPFF
jgi:hypothetical protein